MFDCDQRVREVASAPGIAGPRSGRIYD